MRRCDCIGSSARKPTDADRPPVKPAPGRRSCRSRVSFDCLETRQGHRSRQATTAPRSSRWTATTCSTLQPRPEACSRPLGEVGEVSLSGWVDHQEVKAPMQNGSSHGFRSAARTGGRERLPSVHQAWRDRLRGGVPRYRRPPATPEVGRRDRSGRRSARRERCSFSVTAASGSSLPDSTLAEFAERDYWPMLDGLAKAGRRSERGVELYRANWPGRTSSYCAHRTFAKLARIELPALLRSLRARGLSEATILRGAARRAGALQARGSPRAHFPLAARWARPRRAPASAARWGGACADRGGARRASSPHERLLPPKS